MREFADDNFDEIKIEESSSNGYKTLWEKEKLLITSNFPFFQSVFKRVRLQTRKNRGVVKEGRLGRSPKASQSALPGQKCPRLPSREGKLGRFRPRLPSREGKLGRPSQIALPGGQSGDSLPH